MRKVALNCVWMRDVVRYMMTWEDGMENMPDARWMDRSRLGRGGGGEGFWARGKAKHKTVRSSKPFAARYGVCRGRGPVMVKV